MITVLALLGLILGAWSVRSICIKQQSNIKKLVKSFVAAFYFLAFGGLSSEDINKMLVAIVMLLLGAAIQWYANRRDKTPEE
ncbi:hypothetical protein VRB37_09625 [Erwinia billingiae]|uniref:hypothetical protein n=1 Tax=Erwinia billingiae TaxID=182337 RepID=UPI0030CD72AF